MRNTPIFYFSGTGNTWWAAGKLVKKLNSRGEVAERISIEQPDDIILNKIEKADIILLAYPVYGSDRPEIVKDFLTLLPVRLQTASDKSIPFGIICTQLGFSGDGAWLEHELIEDKGYSLDWAVHINMPNNISIPGFPFRYTNDYHRIRKILKKADRKLEKTAEAVKENRQMKQGTSFFWKLMGLLQRAPFRKLFTSFQDLLSVDKTKCTQCEQCIRLCPTSNIIPGKDGFPDFQGKCILCLRCYNFCPETALQYNMKPFKPRGVFRDKPYKGPVKEFDPFLLKE